MPGPEIRFDRVNLSLSNVGILRDVGFTVLPGQIHCLIGPNGGGKTSLIRCLLGQMPHTGSIEIGWRDGRTIGYVPQSLDFDKTLPITVNDFMAMVCQHRRPAFLGLGKSAAASAGAALERVGFKLDKRRTKLGSLSGGERQRVLFAQALVPSPDLLILDEPMTSMDEVGAGIFLELIRELAGQGTTVVWIAHELHHVRTNANQVTCVANSILFSGAPADVLGERSAETLFRPVESAS